jgi:predicted lipid-binding transport protein (Tim44 family)
MPLSKSLYRADIYRGSRRRGAIWEATMIPRRYRPWTIAAVLFTAVAFVATEVDARSGRGGSFGSRGSRTYSAPPTTNTAPKAAAPIQRSTTPSTATTSGQTAGRTGTTGATGGLMGRPGFLGGLAAGFLGAGLIGLLFGHGLLGGLAGLASILGLVLQVGLIALLGWLAWSWWQRRGQPAPAYAGPSGPSSYKYERADYGASSSSGASMMPAMQGDVTIEPADYDTFEQMLSEIQEAYSNEDVEALRKRVTPELLGYFAHDLADNASRGVVNKVADVKLVSGDLAEAWREGHVEYATVAMRFELHDWFVERGSGKVVEGDPTGLVEATELWTFRRASGGQWMLSAVQQTE